ncbi:CPBP family intramembrane metalloprotease [Rubrobacter tropicus]|uniref:CPBP family intramembrane metalloprotease n=1 Tax=Rubrobacter tropicus TaxID=2653851 RepID=A0A6G8Q9V9_9ACTN|nr:CPBP family intramembrane glutamic endopeptidase [Rubrobacter tropicus]QIN83270.1 CPBP family intramembrane metalloprotease [Rubrobacter tropicus]
MSTTTANQPSAAPSPLRRVVARHPVTTFLLMAYAIGWTVFSPVILSEMGLISIPVEPSLMMVTSAASVLALALPALLVTVATGGRDGVRDLLARCLRWRVGIRWYLLALLGPLAATLLVSSAFLGLSPLEALVRKWPLLVSVFLPEILVPLVLIQLFEEAGWTGFMQNALQERRGPLLASLLVAPAFALMHLPLVLLDVPRGGFVPFVVGIAVQVALLTIIAVFFRVVIMWIYNRARRSVLIVALFHSSFNSATGSGDARFTSELVSGPAAMLVPVAVLVVLAVVILTFTRGRLSYKATYGERAVESSRGRGVERARVAP